MTEPIVYLNGRTVPASEASLAIFDAGVVMGATVTEMIRTYRRRPFRLAEHVARLGRSLKFVRFDIGMSLEDAQRRVEEVVEHNAALLPHPDDDLGVVMFVTAGELPTYAGSAGGSAKTRPTFCIHTFPLPFEMWAEKLEHGLHLVTPSIRHVPPQCIDPKMKCRSRMHYYLADQQARLVDENASALLLDLEGNVTETSGSNFLIIEDGQIVSPCRDHVLPGVSQQMAFELAEQLGIGRVERNLQVFNVVNAEEAMTASTPYGLLPVTRINNLPIADGRPGANYTRLMDAWSQQVGLDVRRQFIEGANRRRAAPARSASKD